MRTKRLLPLLLALVMVFSLAMPAFAAEGEEPAAAALPEAGKGDIVILHSNDVHGQIQGVTGDSKNPVPNGYAYMAALKAYYKGLGAEVLLVDAGDYIQGDPYVNLSKGATAIELMNLAGYDFAALGNHEFDFGYANMVELEKQADFEILSANTMLNGKPVFGTHAVVELGGKKVGIFGMETPETATKAHPAKLEGVEFLSGEEMYACAQAEVDALKDCDYIICLGHLGVDDETAATANRSIDMLKEVKGIDVFIDGHSHSTIDFITGKIGTGKNKVGDTYVTSTGTKFNNYGVVILKADGAIQTELVSAEEAAKLTPDKGVADRAQKIIDDIEKELGVVFAKTEVELNGAKAPGNRTEETNLGDLITDAMLWFATKDGGLEVNLDHVVALTNGGGIRATIKAGDITMKNINTVLPFGNTVAIVYVTGEALLEALEASTFCTPEAVGGFPQVAGVEFTLNTAIEFDQGEQYPGSTYFAPKTIKRVTINSINGKPFDPKATYAVVTNDFTAAGGDTYYSFKVAPSVMDTGTPLDEAVVLYIKEVLKGVVPAKLYGEVRGSIKIIHEAPKDPTQPPTGDFVAVWMALAAFSGTGLAVVSRKRKHI